jgi:hypothetical protein
VDDNTGGTTHPRQVPAWARTIAPDTIDRRIVHERFWIDINAHIWQLDEMATAHIEAVIAMLRSDLVVWLYDLELLERLVLEIAAAEEGRLGEEGMMASLGLPTIADADPLAWLESTELVRALRAELRRRRSR